LPCAYARYAAESKVDGSAIAVKTDHTRASQKRAPSKVSGSYLRAVRCVRGRVREEKRPSVAVAGKGDGQRHVYIG